MSRKRSHTRAFAIADASENGIYFLPGCYHSPQLECPMCDECYNPMELFFMDEQPHRNAITGSGLYIADAFGNVFYNSDVGYIMCEEIVCFSEAQMETDELSDPGTEYENKKARIVPSSDEEEPNEQTSKKLPGYTVTEPSEEDEAKNSSK